MTNATRYTIAGKEVEIAGRFPRIIQLHAEYHEYFSDPLGAIDELRRERIPGELFTFLEPVYDPVPRYDFPRQEETVAVLEIESYEHWWKEQVNAKTRNMVRKAGKKGVEVRLAEFDDDFVAGIKAVYDEYPLRQGRPFKHYALDAGRLRELHSTLLDRSVFIGAYNGKDLIGFIKLVLQERHATIMNIFSLMGQRDKAPTNALLARAVEICADRGVHFLQYGTWSRRSMGDFKKHNAFKPVTIPRYFVPLNRRGRIAYGLRMHRRFQDVVPEKWQDSYAGLRSKWHAFRMRDRG